MKSTTAARILWPLWVGLIFSLLGFTRSGTDWLRERNLLRLTVGAVFLVAAVALVVALLRQPPFRRPRTAVVLAGVAAVGGLLMLTSEQPEERLHLVEYGVLALLGWFALPSPWSRPRKLVVAFLVTSAVGWADEVVQGTIPGRINDLHDVVLNAVAGLWALCGWAVLEKASEASWR